MTQTVVGIFDNPDAAHAAEDAIMEQGVDQSAFELVSTAGSAGNDQESLKGIRTFLTELFGPESQEAEIFAEAVRRGNVLLAVDMPDEADTSFISQAMRQAGMLELDECVEQWGQEESESVPVIQERMEVGKRQEEQGAVRVTSRQVETPVQQDINLREERADIERRPVDRPLSPDEAAALGDRTIEVPETAEKAVVGKSARVVEEVQVGKKTHEKTQTVQDTVRHTEVDVERQPAGSKGKGGKK